LNNVRLQDAKFQELVAHYQSTVLNAAQEVEDGLVVYLQSQQEAKDLGVSVAAAQKAVKVAVAQYKGGLTDFNRVAVLLQNLVGQQDQYAQAQADIARGLIQVYRALGGGWEIRLHPNNANNSLANNGNSAPTQPEQLPAPQPAPVLQPAPAAAMLGTPEGLTAKADR
jgi:outer membrane protein TolC